MADTTVTYPGGIAMSPMLALTESYEATAESSVVSHTILDGPPVHTLRAAGPDRGTLTLLFADEITARDAYTAHKLAAVFTIVDATRVMLNFRYVVAGTLGIRLDPDTKRRWIVTVPFEAVV